jgi:ribokinase
MSDLVVLGSLNMDLVVRTRRIPRPGETVLGDQFTTIPGGKGANQAAAAARLGGRVEMIGRVGQDGFGPQLLENMRAQGVGVGHVCVDPEAPSGIALISVAEDGENTIIVAPGANGRVGPSDLASASDAIRGAQYLMMQFEVPLPTVRAAIEMADAAGVRVILNPAPAEPVSSDFFQGVYCLVANETEAALLTGVAVADLPSAEAAGRAMLGLGVSVSIVTLGARGALLVTGDGGLHVPARRVRVVDTTAAGDAFVGGLSVALLDGFDLAEAVRYATCAGTLATTVLGAQTSLPTREQVQSFYESGT